MRTARQGVISLQVLSDWAPVRLKNPSRNSVQVLDETQVLLVGRIVYQIVVVKILIRLLFVNCAK